MSVTSLIAGTLMLATSAEATLISNPDIFCLSHAIYWETRGVEAQGASMVGEVVLNRVEHEEFPNTVCDVVNQPWQFAASSAMGAPIIEPQAFDNSVRVAIDTYLSGNRDNDALFFINSSVGMPNWARNLRVVGRYGDHVFLTFRDQ
ncbi:MAG: cell wall hydrolase [Rhodospirillaceae bacterium]|nr:cell wall hydrolase [Rhodospirillaceae bacterium]